MLELLPKAQAQAHERIIGGRPVASGEKILRLYDTDVQVIVRGKAGAEVEFGNTVLVGENRQGLILDFQIYQDQAPADAHLLVESLARVQAALGRTVGAVGADRGFANETNRQGLAKAEIFDGVCPRQPEKLKARMKVVCESVNGSAVPRTFTCAYHNSGPFAGRLESVRDANGGVATHGYRSLQKCLESFQRDSAI